MFIWGVKIAPRYRKMVAYVMGVLGVIGLALFPAIVLRNGWAIWGGVCVIIGIGGILYAIYVGKIDTT